MEPESTYTPMRKQRIHYQMPHEDGIGMDTFWMTRTVTAIEAHQDFYDAPLTAWTVTGKVRFEDDDYWVLKNVYTLRERYPRADEIDGAWMLYGVAEGERPS